MKKSILKYFKAFTLIGIMASVTVLSSCGEDDGGEPAATLTAYGILGAETNLGKLKSEIDVYADLVATLDNADAELTVFAPSDAAMSTLLGTLGLQDFSTVSEGVAKSVLSYHVSAAGALATGDLTEGLTVMTAQGEMITVAAGQKLSTGATALSTITNSINATNGIVHVIDVVIIPPTIGAQIVATLGTVAQPVLLGSSFTILAQAIAKADAAQTDPTATIIAALIGGSNLTVFAPTNATFEVGQITAATYDAATWNAILRNHVVIGGTEGTTIGSDEMGTEGFTATSALGVPLAFSTGPAMKGVGIYIDSDLNQTPNAEVALIDAAVVGNGRIHVIAGVLAPPQ